MSTPNVPRKLSTLIELLRRNGVTSYSDDKIKLTFATALPAVRQIAEADGDAEEFFPASRRPPNRPEKDAVALAIAGIDYDPDEVSDFEAEDLS